MKKILSQIVIFLLLVIAPVSFSTDKIPNYDKPATKSHHLQESRKSTIAVVRRTTKLLPVVAALSPKQIFISHPASPVYGFNLEIAQGRAPPSVHSV